MVVHKNALKRKPAFVALMQIVSVAEQTTIVYYQEGL